MKKLFITLLACALTLICLLACTSAVADDTTKPSDAAQPITSTMAFDTDDEPRFPYPITRLSYQAYIDHPAQFEAQKIAEDPKSAEWTPVEPITLYRWSDDSWRSTAPDDIPLDQLHAEDFYLMKPGYNYRLIADYSSRLKNIPQAYTSVDYFMYNVYSGKLAAGHTGIISLELDEQVDEVCIIHHSQIRIASIDGVNFMPRSYTSNIDGLYTIEFHPTDSIDNKDYYSQATIDLILQEESIAIPLHNLLG